MKIHTLTILHNRSILELELIDECEKRVLEYSRMLKAKEENYMNHWAWSNVELTNLIKKTNETKKRLYTWYLQTLNKIMRYSN